MLGMDVIILKGVNCLHFMTLSKSLRVCLKNGNRPAAVLLSVRFVGPFLTARFRDARNGSPRAQPKSLAAGQFRFFRQTLIHRTVLGISLPLFAMQQ